MTTIAVPAYHTSTEEHNDREFHGKVWDFGGVSHRNKFGGYSQAVRPLFGQWINYSTKWVSPGYHNQFTWAPKWTSLMTGVVGNGIEGYCSISGQLIFKDLGIPQGATIVSAVIDLYQTAHSNPGDLTCFPGWTFKIYAVAEDDLIPFRYLSVFPYTYLGECFPPGCAYEQAEGAGGIPYSRRVVREGWCYAREHTRNAVQWHWAYGSTGPDGQAWGTCTGGSTNYAPAVKWTTPDISSVIQEIVNRPKWLPNNKLALVLDDDEMGKLFTAGEYNFPSLPSNLFAAFVSYLGVWGIPSQYHPVLRLEYV